MWLLLAQDSDAEAAWLADGLRARTEQPVELVTADALVHDCQWEHRLGAAGVTSRLVTESGAVVDSGTVTGVVNRLHWLSTHGFGGASAADRVYASAEFFALALSWLASFGSRVLNRPAGTGLAGAWRTDSQWRALARLSGLPIVHTQSNEPAYGAGDEDDHVALVIDGELVDDPDRPLTRAHLRPRAGLAELQRASGLDLLEVRLAAGEPAALRSVTSVPTMSRFGEPGLDALARALTVRGERSRLTGSLR